MQIKSLKKICVSIRKDKDLHSPIAYSQLVKLVASSEKREYRDTTHHHTLSLPIPYWLLMFFLLFLTSPLFAGEDYEYDLFFGGSKAGYHRASIDYSDKGLFVTSSTHYKLLLSGKGVELSFNEKTSYDLATHPQTYNLELETNGEKRNIHTIFLPDSVIRTTSDNERSSHSIDGPVYLLDNNIVNHYTLLLRKIDYTRVKEMQSFNVFVPQIDRLSTLSLSITGRDTVLNYEVYKLAGELGGVSFIAYADVAMKFLVKLRFAR